ncbi:MAG: endonuclease MutS2 [Clostridia bacterium]|nr:endonuclease MutS2 [Clostridia bacterium]
MNTNFEESRIFTSDSVNSISFDGFKRAVRTLEFDKILNMLADCAPFEGCIEVINSITPSVSRDFIVTMQKQTTEARNLVNTKGTPSFGGIKDISNALFRAEKGACLNTLELLSVADVLRAVSSVTGYFGQNITPDSSLYEFSSRLVPNKYLYESITNAVIGEDLISDTATSELYDIRRKMKNAGSKAKDCLQRYVSGEYSKYLQENIITMRNGRYVIPVRAEYKNEIKGLVHDTSSSGATLFIEPMAVVEANNELRMLEIKEQAEIEKILFHLTSEVSRFSDVLKIDYSILCDLGVVFAKAELSFRMNGVSPIITSRKNIILKKARHPLLDKEKVVPIDVSIGNGYSMLIVTGPNTGGKTVTLKTLGLFSIMAQSGLHIPCDDGSVVPVFTNILADIGDEQSIEQSLSTFSAHMVNIVDILGKVTDTSLVLFDELGAGTDPIEGAALAEAILEKIRNMGCLCAATTHYAELKAYALETEGVSNASCEFNIETLSPTYKLTIGLPGRSNAFAIAERLGLDRTIITAANDYVPGASRRFEEVVNELENARSGLEKEREQARKLKEELKEAKERAKKDREELNQKISDLEAKAEREARRLIDSAKAASDYIFEELDEIRRKKEAEDFAKAIAQSKANVAAKVKQASDKLGINLERAETIYKPSREFKQGDEILVYDLKQKGKILKIDKDQYYVQIGYAKLKTNKENLRLLIDIEEDDSAKKKKASTMRKVNRNGMATPAVSRDIRSEIDVRGMIGDDAWLTVDKYIDNAVLANLGSVTVIHGKGTGALRAAITQRLRRDKRVDSFRSGAYGEGDSGVTVITLK